jgi:hypothetical protein
MNLLGMALITYGGRVHKGEDRPDFMPNLSVAICTFDLMVGDMFFVHEWGGIFGIQYLRFFIAMETFPLRDMAISSNDIDMTLFTGHPSRNILPVIEAPAFDLDIPFRFNMAGGATSNGTGYALIFPFWPGSIKMTDETVCFMNR